MKTARLCCGLLIGFLVFSGGLAAAQKQVLPKYDLASEIKVKGSIESIKEVPNSYGKLTCVHLMLKTDKGPLEVQVAPVDFLNELEITFHPGEALEITGSKVKTTGDAGELLLTREILRKTGDSTVVTRDPKGDPVWTFMMTKQN